MVGGREMVRHRSSRCIYERMNESVVHKEMSLAERFKANVNKLKQSDKKNR